jgi:hypothetical protein
MWYDLVKFVDSISYCHEAQQIGGEESFFNISKQGLCHQTLYYKGVFGPQ